MLHHFAPSIHTMWLRVRDLRISRGWSTSSLAGDDETPGPAKVRSWLTGTAVLDDDALTVIGADMKPTKALTFTLAATPPEKLADRWGQLKRLRGDWFASMPGESSDPQRTALVQYLRNVYEEFDAKAPTATIGFEKADWELGRNEGWTLTCDVPPAIFGAIVADVHAGRCPTLRLGLDLHPTLTDDEYAPPSVAVTYGVVCQGKHDGGTNHGWVTHVSWVTSGVDSDEPQPSRLELDDEEGDETASQALTVPSPPSATSLSPMASAAELEQLSRTVRRGFVCVFILLVLVALFR